MVLQTMKDILLDAMISSAGMTEKQFGKVLNLLINQLGIGHY